MIILLCASPCRGLATLICFSFIMTEFHRGMVACTCLLESLERALAELPANQRIHLRPPQAELHARADLAQSGTSAATPADNVLHCLHSMVCPWLCTHPSWLYLGINLIVSSFCWLQWNTAETCTCHEHTPGRGGSPWDNGRQVSDKGPPQAKFAGDLLQAHAVSLQAVRAAPHKEGPGHLEQHASSQVKGL